MTAPATDVPAGLMFVDPNEVDSRYRTCLWGPSGAGKSVGAASAPGPLLVLTADRPGAWRFARAKFPEKEIHEARFAGIQSFTDVYRWFKNPDNPVMVRTLVLDPFKTMVDAIVDESPKQRDGNPNWAAINKKILGFLHSLREFDINLILIAHERLSDSDGKMYPELGGPSLINKICAEMDIIAHVEREADKDGAVKWMAQLAETPQLVCKDSTPGGLGPRREINLTEWFEAGDAPMPDTADLPWDEDFEAGKQKLGDVTEDA